MADLTPADLELLSAYLDDELAPDERADLERRLATDDVLWAEMDGLQQVTALVRDHLPVPRAPRDFRLDPAVYGRPARLPASQSSFRRFYRQWGAVVAVAATLAVVVGVGLSLMGPETSNILEEIVTELQAVDSPGSGGVGVAVAPTATELILEATASGEALAELATEVLTDGEELGAASSETERQGVNTTVTMTATLTVTPTPQPTMIPPGEGALAAAPGTIAASGTIAAPEVIAAPETVDTSEAAPSSATSADASADDAMIEAVEESGVGATGESLDSALLAPTPTAAIAQALGGPVGDEVSLTATTLTQELGGIVPQPGAFDGNAVELTATVLVEGYFAATTSPGTLAAPAVAQPPQLAAMSTATRLPLTATSETQANAVDREAGDPDADHVLRATATALANEARLSTATSTPIPSSAPLAYASPLATSPQTPLETQQDGSPPSDLITPQNGRDDHDQDGEGEPTPFSIDPGIFVGAVIILLTLATGIVALRRRRA